MLCGILGISAMLIYAFIYTPLKKVTPLTIVPGAVAGSLPVVIGCVAATGNITTGAIILFTLQFIWQFPHTWSIAWLLDDEYNKAGIENAAHCRWKKQSFCNYYFAFYFLNYSCGIITLYVSIRRRECYLATCIGRCWVFRLRI